MNLALVLTNDWELYGDGSGDYFSIQHDRLEPFLAAAGNHGARLTIMAELGQQWAHRALAGEQAWAAEIARAWDQALEGALRRGADVQLHLHPQWLGARRENGRFLLDFTRWAITALPQHEIGAVLERGKADLEALLRPVRPAYRCIAFRAGAYCIEPSALVLPELERRGFLCDTSVTRGWHDPRFYDYRAAHSNVVPWYASREDVRREAPDASGILEIPIHSSEGIDSPLARNLAPRSYYRVRFGERVAAEDILWSRAKRRHAAEAYPLTRRPMLARRLASPRFFLSKVGSLSATALNYDDLPPAVFAGMLERIANDPELDRALGPVVLPVVAIGHVKFAHDPSNLERSLEIARRRLGSRLSFATLSEAVALWRSSGPAPRRRSP